MSYVLCDFHTIAENLHDNALLNASNNNTFLYTTLFTFVHIGWENTWHACGIVPWHFKPTFPLVIIQNVEDVRLRALVIIVQCDLNEVANVLFSRRGA